MLMLTRKLGEEIVITVGDDKIVIQLAKIITYGKAMIGVQAPPHVSIDRQEVYAAKEQGPTASPYAIRQASRQANGEAFHKKGRRS